MTPEVVDRFMSTNTSHALENVTQMTPEAVEEFLSRLQEEELQYFIPTIIFLLAVVVIGFSGNSLVLVVYQSRFNKTPSRTFIISLAVVDLLTIIFNVSGDIFSVFHLWDYPSDAQCKFINYITAVTTMFSSGVLLALSVARYRKICRPFGWQVTTKNARVAVTLVAAFACVGGISSGVFSGIKLRPTSHPDIHGKGCSVAQEYQDTVWPVVFFTLFLALFIAMCIPLVVLYCLIGIKAYRHREFVGAPGAKGKRSFKDRETSFNSSDNEVMDKSPLDKLKGVIKTGFFSREKAFTNKKGGGNAQSQRHPSIEEKSLPSSTENLKLDLKTNTEDLICNHQLPKGAKLNRRVMITSAAEHTLKKISDDGGARETHDDSNDKQATSLANQGRSESVPVRILDQSKMAPSSPKGGVKPGTATRTISKTTRMIVAITVVYFLSYVPSIIILLYLFSAPDQYDKLDGLELSLVNLFLASNFINSAANPVIYSICDQKFRHEVGQLYVRHKSSAKRPNTAK